MRRLAVLGAGLSGLTTAINLARERYDVDVYEKNKDVGTRFRGDLQGLENWSARKDILEELREMNIKANFDCDPFSRVTLTTYSRTKEIVFKRPLFYLVKRGSFSGTIDYGLKAQALELSIKMHFEETRSPNEVDIVATGSILKEVPAVVKGIVFKTDVKDAAIVLCNDKFALKGYSYLLVTKGYGCLCTVCTVDEPYRVNRCFEKTKAFFEGRIGLNMRSPKEVGGVGSFSPKSVYKKGTTLYVGEAAGLQDFLWGFGMRFAVTSGYLAARSIINNEDYEQIAEKHFENKLKASVVNRYLWEEVAAKNDYSLLIYLADFVKKILHSMHNYNLLQRVAYPMASYHLKKKHPKLRL